MAARVVAFSPNEVGAINSRTIGRRYREWQRTWADRRRNGEQEGTASPPADSLWSCISSRVHQPPAVEVRGVGSEADWGERHSRSREDHGRYVSFGDEVRCTTTAFFLGLPVRVTLQLDFSSRLDTTSEDCTSPSNPSAILISSRVLMLFSFYRFSPVETRGHVVYKI